MIRWQNMTLLWNQGKLLIFSQTPSNKNISAMLAYMGLSTECQV